MTQRTSDKTLNGTMAPLADDSCGSIYGEFHAVIFRADGSIEDKGWKRNIVTKLGLNRIANRAVNDASSKAGFLAIGTATAAASLNAAVTSFGEVGRKISTVLTTAAQSREWFFMVATWGGAADGLTGVVLDSAVITDHVNSGLGQPWNIVNGLAVTLQGSDVLNLTARIRVGSHDIDHTA